MKKILVVCAHPGDAVFGCGGTLALYAREKAHIRVIVLGDGWTSRVKSLEKGQGIIDLEPLEAQEREALGAIGIEEVFHFRLPDNRLDNYPLLDLIKRIEEIQASFPPEVVLTNSASDLNVDQQRTCQAVVTAFRPQPGRRGPTIMAFESPSSTEWNAYEQGRGYNPNWFIDIGPTLEAKLAAMEKLSSEIRPWPHPRSLQAVEHLARWRGASVGVEAAEALVLLRAVSRTDAGNLAALGLP